MATGMQATNLRCNDLVNPLAVDDLTPTFGWEIIGAQRGECIAGFCIEVASTCAGLEAGAADLWRADLPAQEQRVRYAGAALAAFQRCWWRVRVSGGTWSQPATFAIGMLSEANCKGGWIAYPIDAIHNVRRFRKEFTPAKPVARAMLYATARGIYLAEINGQRVSEDVFTPGWTDYLKRMYYNAYDVTALLQSGANAIGLSLGEGWYKGAIGFSEKRNNYGFRPEVLANVRLEYTDGSVETIATDESWTTATGPVLQAGFLPGENFDARLCGEGWSRPGDGKGWQKVNVNPLEGNEYWDNASWSMVRRGTHLSAYPTDPVRRTQELPVRDSWSVMPGSRIYDFGQNFAGRVRLRLNGRPGQMVRLRHGEMVNPDRTLYVENLRTADSTDTYVCRGGGEETWEPDWTFHGFRYAELTGLEEGQTAELTGIVLGSDTPRAGEFSCSDPLLNQLYSNIVWTQRANFLEVPTDCPQRDERLGWTGDAQVFIRTAACNMDVAAFFRKWLTDLADTQSADGAVANVAPMSFLQDRADAAWGDAAVICPWWLYQIYGDKDALRRFYPMMRGWLEYLRSTSKDDLRGTWTFCFGDWLSVDESTPKEVIQSAMYAYVADLMRQTAAILGESADEAAYQTLRQRIEAAFLREFVSPDGIIRGDTQTAYVLALKFDLLPPSLRQNAADRLVANLEARGVRLATGFVGTPYLLPVLSKIGRDDLAFRLLFNEEYPSWGYSIRNGATSIWERWNGWKKDEGCGDANMNSFSHYAYGSVGEWIFSRVAGIDLLEPGFRRLRIAPGMCERLSWVKAAYHSVRGRIVSEWRRDESGLSLTVEIPAGTTAEIVLPVGKRGSLTADGQPLGACPSLRQVREEDGAVVLQAGCGRYELRSE